MRSGNGHEIPSLCPGLTTREVGGGLEAGMDDAAAGVLDPGVDREGAVEQRKVVEVELHPVAAGHRGREPG